MEAMLKHAQDVLRMEAEAVLELVPRVDESFASAVQMILDCSGRTVAICGTYWLWPPLEVP